jgi:hypothetical protein
MRWGASQAAAWVKWRRKGRELREEQPCEWALAYSHGRKTRKILPWKHWQNVNYWLDKKGKKQKHFEVQESKLASFGILNVLNTGLSILCYLDFWT